VTGFQCPDQIPISCFNFVRAEIPSVHQGKKVGSNTNIFMYDPDNNLK